MGLMMSCIRKCQLCVFAEIDHLKREALPSVPPPMYMNFRSSESEELRLSRFTAFRVMGGVFEAS
jgi:hypothetical protein